MQLDSVTSGEYDPKGEEVFSPYDNADLGV